MWNILPPASKTILGVMWEETFTATTIMRQQNGMSILADLKWAAAQEREGVWGWGRGGGRGGAPEELEATPRNHLIAECLQLGAQGREGELVGALHRLLEVQQVALHGALLYEEALRFGGQWQASILESMHRGHWYSTDLLGGYPSTRLHLCLQVQQVALHGALLHQRLRKQWQAAWAN